MKSHRDGLTLFSLAHPLGGGLTRKFMYLYLCISPKTHTHIQPSTSYSDTARLTLQLHYANLFLHNANQMS